MRTEIALKKGGRRRNRSLRSLPAHCHVNSREAKLISPSVVPSPDPPRTRRFRLTVSSRRYLSDRPTDRQSQKERRRPQSHSVGWAPFVPSSLPSVPCPNSVPHSRFLVRSFVTSFVRSPDSSLSLSDVRWSHFHRRRRHPYYRTRERERAFRFRSSNYATCLSVGRVFRRHSHRDNFDFITDVTTLLTEAVSWLATFMTLPSHVASGGWIARIYYSKLVSIMKYAFFKLRSNFGIRD